jgi:eukaryotic-like serine/threonine-protein kinase
VGFFSSLFGGSKGKGPRIPIVDIKKRFELLGRTGQGSMSKVWRARDGKIGRTVCLKILDKEKAAKFDARFPGLVKPSEGAVLMSLRHKNVVQTYEYGLTTQREPFLVMELIEGDGLNFLIETHSPKLNGKRVDYLVQVADGMEYIHNQKYMHRDICPRNIMVTHAGLVKIIDFGLTIPYTPAFCRPGNRTGTPDYLAPEVIKRVTTDHRVDLFALGVTAYETFLGTLPWEKARGSMEVLQKHMNVPGRDPREVRPDLEPELVRFLQKGIERDRDKRFQTAAEFREALKALPRQDY